MKWIAVIFGLLFTALAAVFILLFTPSGNNIIAPLVEKQINAAIPLETSLKKFELTGSTFALVLQLSEHNRVEASGSYSLFDQSLNAVYQVKADELDELQALTVTPLYGVLHTDGTVTGGADTLHIVGKSDVASSNTGYNIVLTAFSPSSIQADIDNAKVDLLLAMLGQKPYSSSDLSLKVDLKSIDPKAMDGTIAMTMMRGHVNTKLMQEDFNLTLPETTYTMKLDSRLEGAKIIYTENLTSNLAHIVSEGTVTPEPLETDLSYELNIKELALFKPLTNLPLRGPLATSGSIKGDKEAMRILGNSDIAGSKTNYDVSLKAFKPQKVIAAVNHAKVEKLLYLAGEPDYASGNLDVDLTLNDLNPDNLRGNANVKITRGTVNTAVMKKVYDITLPPATFTYDLDAILNGESIDYSTIFASNLAQIDSEGIIIPKTSALNLEYRLAISKLELLKPVTNAPLRGELLLNGSAKGDKKLLTLLGQSDIAKSDTTFTVKLAEFAPKSIRAKIKRLQLKNLLYMVTQPDYANALVDVDISVTNAKAGELRGNIVSLISHGTVNGETVAKEFDLKPMPRVTFRGQTETSLNGNLIDTKAKIISTLADLTVKQARMDLAKGLTTSDYQANIHNLDKLYFATERHLQGSMTVSGDLKIGEHLDVSAHSKTLGGRVDATLHDDDLHADLTDIQTLDTLHMLIYPEIFKSSLNGRLDYNLLAKKGKFDAKLSDGRFAQNEMLDLVRQFGHLDLYKEKFTGTLLSQINKELIYSDLDLRSNKASITGQRIKLDSKTKQIKAKLDIVANKNPLTVTIKGNVDQPDVKLDAGKIIEKEATKQLDRLFKKLF